MFLLDTDTVSHALRRPVLDQRLAALDPADWCISAVTRGELRYGLAIRPEATRLRALVEGFLAAARCAPWDEAAADRYGQLRASLRASGDSFGVFDEMIAAHALALGATLATGALRHFGRVTGLALEDWIPRR